MKSAKEMYKKINMECISETKELIAYASKTPINTFIKSCYITYLNSEVKNVSVVKLANSISFNIDEIKAMYQQCKDLGWIE